MADWFHRDCSDTHCFWMMPNCREERQKALALDPNRTMTWDELDQQLHGTYDPRTMGVETTP